MPSPPSPSPSSLLPAAPASRRRRRLLVSPNPSAAAATAPASSSASSSSASSSSASFSFPSPAPSPFHHRFLSPLRASAVPFSWEHRPGIPKTPARGTARGGKLGASGKAPPLPLPPSLFSNKSSRVVAEYPFAAATAAYSDKARRRGPRRQQQQRRWPAVTDALADWLAVLSLYRSCTRSRDCLAAAGPPPQPRRRVPA